MSGHLDYRKQLDIIMKAVGVQTRDELLQSSQPSSNAVSPVRQPGQGSSPVDLSSSDDEVHGKNWVIVPDVMARPVILEDYSQAGKTQVREDVIPCSASFDSGVEISKVPESESVDRLAGGEQVTSPLGADQVGNLPTSSSNINEKGDLSSCKPVDRIGDAGAGDEDDDARENLDDADVLRETQEDEASTLQRKKMFDSMYRLVLDDDLLDVMNDEDEYLPETDGSS